mgnify:CR=1 FL=1
MIRFDDVYVFRFVGRGSSAAVLLPHCATEELDSFRACIYACICAANGQHSVAALIVFGLLCSIARFTRRVVADWKFDVLSWDQPLCCIQSSVPVLLHLAD